MCMVFKTYGSADYGGRKPCGMLSKRWRTSPHQSPLAGSLWDESSGCILLWRAGGGAGGGVCTILFIYFTLEGSGQWCVCVHLFFFKKMEGWRAGRWVCVFIFTLEGEGHSSVCVHLFFTLEGLGQACVCVCASF